MERKYAADCPDWNSRVFEMKDIARPFCSPGTNRLFDILTYDVFVFALLCGTKIHLDILENLAEIYVEAVDGGEGWVFGPLEEHDILGTYEGMQEFLPLKVSLTEAGAQLRKQLELYPFRNGMELGVVSALVDVSRLEWLDPSLPYYTRLGLGYHALGCMNEERQLLTDAFYFAALAKDQYHKMEALMHTVTRQALTGMNENVCSICRTGIVGLFAFFESYVNGIGLNHLYTHGEALSREERFALQGRDRSGNYYMKLETMLECLQRIVGGKLTYATNNPQQLKDETFITLFEKMRGRRDTAVHYSKLKGEIMLSPQEWMDEFIAISHLILDAARKIWRACYPAAVDFPHYLLKLDYELLLENGNSRIIRI